MFEIELKNVYDIKNHNGITCKHKKKVNNIAECNVLYGMINPSKRTKLLNSHYSPILIGCMNTRKGKSRFKNFQILLDSGCSSTVILVRRIKKNLLLKKILQCNSTRNQLVSLPI